MNPIEKLLEEMHLAVAKELLRKIRDGEATAADLSVARQMLKDNHVTSVPKPGDPLDNLATTLPFSGEEEPYDGYAN